MTDIHFLDGGLGQEIQNRATARPHPLWSVKVMYDEPDVVSAVHRDFISAGARVITANTYTASPPRLRRDGDISQIGDIHNTALRLARAAIDKADDPALQLAGCLPPLVGSYVAEVSLDFEASLADYRQLVALQKDGVDLFLIETISNIAEARAALTAVKEADTPGFVGLTICDDHSNRLRSGEALSDALDQLLPLGPDGIMVNCSLPEAVSAAMPGHRFTTAVCMSATGGARCLQQKRTCPRSSAERQRSLWSSIDFGSSSAASCQCGLAAKAACSSLQVGPAKAT